MVLWRNWEGLLESVKKQYEAMCKTYYRLNEVRIEEEFGRLDKRHTEVVDILTSGFKDISAILKAIEIVQRDKSRSELLQWLCSLDPSHNYNYACGKHQMGTGQWLLKLRKLEERTEFFMWLNGKGMNFVLNF
jgi:hypothetical protein